MALDKDKILEKAKATLKKEGFTFDFQEGEGWLGTGRSGLDLIIEAIAEAVVDHIKDAAEVKVTLDKSLNTLFSSGVPVPQDGGTALKTAWSTSTAAKAYDIAQGQPDKMTGGIL